MNEQTTKLYKELREEIKKQLNDPDTPEINEFMPEVGTFLTDEWDCTDNGRWYRRYSSTTVTEEDAVKEAQNELLNGLGVARLDEFFLEGTMRNKVVEFLTALAKEVVE